MKFPGRRATTASAIVLYSWKTTAICGDEAATNSFSTQRWDVVTVTTLVHIRQDINYLGYVRSLIHNRAFENIPPGSWDLDAVESQ